MNKHITTVKKAGGVITFLGVLVALFLGIKDISAIFESDSELAGEWLMTFTVEETTHESFKGKSSEFVIHLNQKGKHLTGSGEKIRYDGKDLPTSQHDPILIDGWCDGDKIFCTYKLDGTRRSTTGSFQLRHTNGTLQGLFSGTAANTRGTVVGKRK